jgi:hypothetical protein
MSSESEEIYEVEEVINRKIKNGNLFYKIKWKGYDLSHASWEKLDNLDNIKDLLAEYDKEHPSDEGDEKTHLKRKRGRPRKDNSSFRENAGLKQNEEPEATKHNSKESEKKNSSSHSTKEKKKEEAIKEKESETKLCLRKRVKSKSKSQSKSKSKSKSRSKHRSRSRTVSSERDDEEWEKEEKSNGNSSKIVKEKKKEKSKEDKSQGNIQYDVPKLISKMKRSNNNREIMVEVQWNKRFNGETPLPTLISSNDLRKVNSTMLLDYYEEKIKNA